MLGGYRSAGVLILFIAAPAAGLSGSCAVNEIVPRCSDGIKNGDESGVDCGGAHCGACEGSTLCTMGSECPSGVCGDQVCSPPSCEDHVLNGDETDIDCGDACTTKCGDGKSCGEDFDCSSNRCVKSVCVSCVNDTKDGDETDIDCGGACAKKCSVGRDCKDGVDCVSNLCAQSLCAPDPTAGCADAVKNGSETDIDCGGGACAACIHNQSCLVDSDCAKTLKCKGTPTPTCQLP